jgi:hypothetical protein
MCFRPPSVEKQENRCPKCGTVNPQEAAVCINCGAELPKAPPPPGVPAAGAGAPPPPGVPGGATPPKAPPAAPIPPKAPPMPPKKPGN